MNKLEEYIKEKYIITNKEVEELGYDRQSLAELTKKNKIERLRPGVYQIKGEVVDDFAYISSNSNRIVFSYHTALYLYNLTDRTPNIFHISVPQGYNASHIKRRNKNIVIHYIKKEWYEVGKTEIKSPQGNIIPAYDLERTICDIIINREKIDKQIFIDAITRYFKLKNNNLRRLIQYSRIFKIEEEVRRYMEVLI